ncbi:MAG: hypothetical protein HFH73_01885 [Lachnospiraceae bacterium]|jgi:hypothetical protein|nr:hypothetical protein [Lachnospiraceae bacterium]
MERKNRDKKVNLLGVYNYTVWLTCFGLFISILGIMEGRDTRAMGERIRTGSHCQPHRKEDKVQGAM